MLDIDENNFAFLFVLSMMQDDIGDHAKALAVAEKTCSLAPWNLVAKGWLAGLLRRAGETRRADEALLEVGDGSAAHAPLGLMLSHLLLSEVDLAAQWAAKAIELREPGVFIFLRTPTIGPLRSSIRWPARARMMNLPESV